MVRVNEAEFIEECFPSWRINRGVAYAQEEYFAAIAMWHSILSCAEQTKNVMPNTVAGWTEPCIWVNP